MSDNNNNTDLLLAGIAGVCLGHLLARKHPRKTLLDRLEPLLPLLAVLATTNMPDASDDVPGVFPPDDLDLKGAPFANLIQGCLKRGAEFGGFDLDGVLAQLQQRGDHLHADPPADVPDDKDPIMSDESENEDNP